MNLKIYKRTQGKNTRLWTAMTLLLIVAVGCWELYEKLNSYAPNNPWVYTVIPAAVCSGLAALIYWLSNKPTIADFLIAAEGEIKKVSWSSRQEIIHSTMIVIVVVAIIAAGLYAVDMGFEVFFDIVVDLY